MVVLKTLDKSHGSRLSVRGDDSRLAAELDTHDGILKFFDRVLALLGVWILWC